MKCAARIFFFVFILPRCCGVLNGQQAATATAAIVPQLVSYSGKATDELGKPVVGIAGVTFAIYQDQSEGVPLWTEIQNVTADSKGNFTVQLGAATTNGLPLDLFSTGQGRWLGIRINGGEEQPRVLLVSVPYALKAADAQTLGGLPPSAFLLAAPVASTTGTTPEPATISSQSSAAISAPAIGGTGTADYVPLWTDSTDLGSSILYQTGTGSSARIGVNTTSPLFTLDVKGTELVRGLFELSTLQYATASKGSNSNPLNLESSAYNSSTSKYTLNHFQWQAEPTGNNTTTPGATLNLLYGTDPTAPAETGLSLSSKGIFTFAPGQTFPGTGNGTVTSVASGAGLTGGPITGSGTLSIATAGVTNAMLQNSALTVTAASPLSGGGSVALGGSTSLGLKSCSNNQVLEYVSGAWICTTLVVPSGGLSGIQEFTQSGTITVPAGVTHLLAEMWGGGGGGGGGVQIEGEDAAFGSGGGAGGYTRAVFPVIPGATYNITLGAGGASGADCTTFPSCFSGASGTAGGDSTITDSSSNTLAKAAGGAGGAGGGVSGCGSGGAGGVGTSGANSLGRTGGSGQQCTYDSETESYNPGAGGVAVIGSISPLGGGGGASDVVGSVGYILITF